MVGHAAGNSFHWPQSFCDIRRLVHSLGFRRRKLIHSSNLGRVAVIKFENGIRERRVMNWEIGNLKLVILTLHFGTASAWVMRVGHKKAHRGKPRLTQETTPEPS